MRLQPSLRRNLKRKRERRGGAENQNRNTETVNKVTETDSKQFKTVRDKRNKMIIHIEEELVS